MRAFVCFDAGLYPNTFCICYVILQQWEFKLIECYIHLEVLCLAKKFPLQSMCSLSCKTFPFNLCVSPFLAATPGADKGEPHERKRRWGPGNKHKDQGVTTDISSDLLQVGCAF